MATEAPSALQCIRALLRDASARNLELAEWAVQYFAQLDNSACYEAVLEGAAATGHLDTCEFAHKNGARHYSRAIFTATMYDQVLVAQLIREWCIAEHQPFDYYAVIDASLRNNKTAVISSAVYWYELDEMPPIRINFTHVLCAIIRYQAFDHSLLLRMMEFALLCDKIVNIAALRETASLAGTAYTRAFLADWKIGQVE